MVLRQLHHQYHQLKQEQSERNKTRRITAIPCNKTSTEEPNLAVETDTSSLTPPSSPRPMDIALFEDDITEPKTLDNVRSDATKYFAAVLQSHKAILKEFCPAAAQRAVMLAARSNWVMVKEANALQDEAKRLAWALGLEPKKK
jgi:hypothetical protein